jgi:predicted dehydrogenase
MSKNKKQTAVIGVGGFGKNHARNLSLISNLVAICDKNEEIGKKQASLYDHVRYYSDIEECLNQKNLMLFALLHLLL